MKRSWAEVLAYIIIAAIVIGAWMTACEHMIRTVERDEALQAEQEKR